MSRVFHTPDCSSHIGAYLSLSLHREEIRDGFRNQSSVELRFGQNKLHIALCRRNGYCKSRVGEKGRRSLAGRERASSSTRGMASECVGIRLEWIKFADTFPLQWMLVVAVILSSALLYGLDTTNVADVQAPVVEHFGSIQKLSWLGMGFPLGSVATILPM